MILLRPMSRGYRNNIRRSRNSESTMFGQDKQAGMTFANPFMLAAYRPYSADNAATIRCCKLQSRRANTSWRALTRYVPSAPRVQAGYSRDSRRSRRGLVWAAGFAFPSFLHSVWEGPGRGLPCMPRPLRGRSVSQRTRYASRPFHISSTAAPTPFSVRRSGAPGCETRSGGPPQASILSRPLRIHRDVGQRTRQQNAHAAHLAVVYQG